MDDASSSQTMDAAPPSPRQPPLYTPMPAATLERINAWRTTNLLAATCACTTPPTPLPHPTSTFLAAETSFWHGTWTYRRHPPPPAPDPDWRPDVCPRCARLGAAAPSTPDPAPLPAPSVTGTFSRLASLCLSPTKRAGAAAKPGPGTAAKTVAGPDSDDDDDGNSENAVPQHPDAGGAPLTHQESSSSSLLQRMRLRKWSFERNPRSGAKPNNTGSSAVTPQSHKAPRPAGGPAGGGDRGGSEYNPSTASTTSNPAGDITNLKVKRAREADARLARARELLEKKNGRAEGQEA